MGRRGPAPTPTPLLRLRGSNRATKSRIAGEVRGPEGISDRPGWLVDELAVAAWDHLVPMLSMMGVLTRIDDHALARYCHLWSRWRKAEEFISKHGEMYPLKDNAGKVKCFQPWPQAAVANKLAVLLTRLEQEFGMTPSARTRIQVDRPALPTDPRKARYFEPFR